PASGRIECEAQPPKFPLRDPHAPRHRDQTTCLIAPSVESAKENPTKRSGHFCSEEIGFKRIAPDGLISNAIREPGFRAYLFRRGAGIVTRPCVVNFTR